MRFNAIVTGVLASIGLDALVDHQPSVAIGEFVIAILYIGLGYLLMRECYDKETGNSDGNDPA